jgi:hypothetical protein
LLVRRLTYFALALAACGPDRKPAEPCPPSPDFSVLISAPGEPIPADTVIRLYYGANDMPEEFVLANPGVQKVLFCSAADRAGNKLPDALPSGGGGGESGAGAEPAVTVEALLCEAWSYGPAELEIETAEFPMQERASLEKESGVCTVESEVELVRADSESEKRFP